MIKIQSVTLESVVHRSEGNIVSDMGGEKVMLSVKNGKYYNLGEIGGMIWDILDQPTTVKKITELMLDQYNVEQTICEEHTLAFVEHLLQEGLICSDK